MTLDHRLHEARARYREPLPDEAAREDRSIRAMTPSRRRWPAVAAVVLLVAGVAGGVAFVDRRHDPGPGRLTAGSTSTTDASATTLTPAPTTPEPVGITVEPTPIPDGQPVTIRLARPGDLMNGGLSLCSTVDAGGGAMRLCTSNLDLAEPTATTARIMLHRRVVTAVGERDCNDATVDCRLVQSDGDPAGLVQSDRLTFAGDGADTTGAGASLGIEALGDGRFRIQPVGLQADPTWLAVRAARPDLLGAMPAFHVALCSYGAPTDPVRDPFGTVLTARWIRQQGASCDVLGEPFTLDPDQPNRTIDVTLRRTVFGPEGRSDCGSTAADPAVPGCGIVVWSSVDNAVGDGGVGGNQDLAAAALVPLDPSWPPTPDPQLTVLTPGPHRSGDRIEVAIEGVPQGMTTGLVRCGTADDWCGGNPAGADSLAWGNGTHELVLGSWIDDCAPDSCYLALSANIKGMPPVAVAALDTPG